MIMGLAFKENCPDLRNSRVVDIAVELESFGIEVDFHDPWVDEGDARLEYGVRLVANPAPGSYDAVVLAVAHEVFSAMGADGVRALGKPEAVLFDVKAIFPREAADLRL